MGRYLGSPFMGNYDIVLILESFQSLSDSLSGTAVIVAGERPRLDAPLNQNLQVVSREGKGGFTGTTTGNQTEDSPKDPRIQIKGF